MAVEAEDLAARLKAEFPHALRSGQVVAYFQPEVELSSGRVVAAESLARWEHPEFGTLPPALFTPLAEQLGLMEELTRLGRPNSGPGTAGGPATAVRAPSPPAWAARPVPNGRARSLGAR